MIDMTIGTLVIGFIVGFILGIFLAVMGISAQALDNIPQIILIISITIIYFFIEANVISSFGTTPGKKLFGIRVSDENGEDLDYLTSVKRSFVLWFQGLALSIPLISLITLIISYNRYTAQGITSWDETYHVKISYQPISTIRMVLGVLLWIITFAINLYINLQM